MRHRYVAVSQPSWPRGKLKSTIPARVLFAPAGVTVIMVKRDRESIKPLETVLRVSFPPPPLSLLPQAPRLFRVFHAVRGVRRRPRADFGLFPICRFRGAITAIECNCRDNCATHDRFSMLTRGAISARRGKEARRLAGFLSV